MSMRYLVDGFKSHVKRCEHYGSRPFPDCRRDCIICHNVPSLQIQTIMYELQTSENAELLPNLHNCKFNRLE